MQNTIWPRWTEVPHSGSTAEGSQAAVPLRSGSTGGDSASVLPLAYQVPTASIRGVFFCVGLCGTSLRQYRSLAAVPPFLRGSTTRFPLSLYPLFCAAVPPKGAVVPLSPAVLPPQGSCFVAPFPCFFHLSGSTARGAVVPLVCGLST